MRLETAIDPRDQTRRRPGGLWFFWISVALLVTWAVAAYLLAPSVWKLYFRHHPALENVDRITHTTDGHPGDPLNVVMVGTEEELIRAMVAIGSYRPIRSRSRAAFASWLIRFCGALTTKLQ